MEKQFLKESPKLNGQMLLEEFNNAAKKIAPVWPLESFVAVNPYLGLADLKFETAAQVLSSVGGIEMTMPGSFYKKKLMDGEITRDDLIAALTGKEDKEVDPNWFILKVLENEEDKTIPSRVSSLIDVASIVTEKDWNKFMISRVSTWAASYFDKGQATWRTTDETVNLFTSWKTEASVDLTPEITGLKNFRKFVKALPDDRLKAAAISMEQLKVPEKGVPIYLHRLLLKTGGWSAYAARIDWDNKLYGGKEGKLVEFLAVLVSWEACVFQSLHSSELKLRWKEAKSNLKEAVSFKQVDPYLSKNLILQDAFDIATQRELIKKFNASKAEPKKKKRKPKAQAIFCIDVRSEVFRRNLEMVDPEMETLGFAGFFAFPINFVPLAHDKGEAQCPVLIPAGPTIKEEIADPVKNKRAQESRIINFDVKQVWKSFRSGAITCFSFVSPMGLFYLPKLFTDSFGITRPVPHPENANLDKKYINRKTVGLEGTPDNPNAGIPVAKRIEMAKNALNAMSLTEGFADLVLIVGHGSTTVNNPHATGLDCGACGGKSGEANAKVAAAVLNDKQVRTDLKKEDIHIPEETIFLACLHDTTTDEIKIFNEEDIPEERNPELEQLKAALAKAGYAARTERASRMFIDDNIEQSIKGRSKDWSQVRPEWGLAGCSAFVVAPRYRTQNLNLGGKSFLHSYDWKKDRNFSVLELIMTAPMVVTSWINLQYYASTVDNKAFGSGNKTLHNVTAGLGVLEGYCGDLRVGLPIQSLHDGEKYQHEPAKLHVIIEAPIEQMNYILEKHRSVRNLFDNKWIYLLAMNEEGKVSHRYTGDLEWQQI